MRQEDSFYQILWRLPLIGCFTAVVDACYILYALVSPTGFKINDLSPQGVIIVLCACGIIPSAMLLSLAYGGNMFRSALGTFAAMLNIYKTAAVADTIPVPIWMRCIAAVFTVTGAIVGGARLMPVTGVQLAKMTPTRSYIVIMGSCVAAVFGRAVGLDLFPVYISVRTLLMQHIMAVNLGAIYSRKHLAIYLFCTVA
ncbi:hypothetical protein WJX79_010702 [Trebouxia sp. C0005]